MPKAVQAPEREEVAIHEAGHVAMILALLRYKAKIVFATIEGGHQAAGLTSRERWPPLLPKDRVQILMAGMAAQVLGCEKRNPGVDRIAAFAEYEERCGYDLRLLEQDHGITIGRALPLMEVCRANLAPMWDRIEAVARELEERGTLFHRESELVFAGDRSGLEMYRQNLLPAKPRREWVARVVPGSDPGVWREHSPGREIVSRFKAFAERHFSKRG